MALTHEKTPMPDEPTLWRAVAERDGSRDGTFVFAVRSTGIYCRPSCPARRPRRDRVAFFPGPDAAEAAGFRACRRCHPRAANGPGAGWLARVCRRLEADGRPPSLAELARGAGVSPEHLQRSFKRVLGVSPLRYAEALRVRRLRSALRAGDSVDDAAHAAGYGSPARAHAAAAPALGMPPGSYRRGGEGMEIAYSVVDSGLGRLLVAATSRGVSAVCLGEADAPLERALREEYPAATIVRDDRALAARVRRVLSRIDGRGRVVELPLDVRRTAFERHVLEELLRIPRGETRSYAQVARAIGRPTAARAVARACATNPVAVVVPCHRVVGSSGRLTGYRWGLERKLRLLEAEREAVATKTGLSGGRGRPRPGRPR